MSLWAYDKISLNSYSELCYLFNWKNYKPGNLWFLNLTIVSYNPELNKLTTLKTHESWGKNKRQLNEMQF